jgi:hypothetical protein
MGWWTSDLSACPYLGLGLVRAGKGGHDVTGQVVQYGVKNSWMDHIGVRMSQGRIVTADGSLGG